MLVKRHPAALFFGAFFCGWPVVVSLLGLKNFRLSVEKNTPNLNRPGNGGARCRFSLFRFQLKKKKDSVLCPLRVLNGSFLPRSWTANGITCAQGAGTFSRYRQTSTSSTASSIRPPAPILAAAVRTASCVCLKELCPPAVKTTRKSRSKKRWVDVSL